MDQQGLTIERERFADYLAERPSSADDRQLVETCGLENIVVEDYPLVVHKGPGQEFLFHPLLRGGFLDDVYECFTEQTLADQFMQTISLDTQSFVPLFAQRCVMSGWRPEKPTP
jgi:hypothetical protein